VCDDMLLTLQAIDDIAVGPSTTTLPALLTDDFTPINDQNWGFLPGTIVGPVCNSTGNALIGGNLSLVVPSAETRDLSFFSNDIVVMRDVPVAAATPAWAENLGEVRSTACGLPTGYVFRGAVRQAVTVPLDVSLPGTTVSLTFSYSASVGCSFPQTFSGYDADAYLAYSVDGGTRWTTLMRFGSPGTGSSCSVTTSAGNFTCVLGPTNITVQLDQFPLARTTATRFRLRQEAFSSNSETWAFANFMVVSPIDQQYVAQLNISVSTVNTTTCFAPYARTSPVRFQISSDFGATYRSVVSPCAPSLATCSVWGPSSDLESPEYARWTLVSFPLGLDPGPALRFRLAASTAGGSGFLLSSIYVGPQCLSACNGQGMCQADGSCRCNVGYSGPDCGVAPSTLLTSFNETFDPINPALWLTITSGGWSFLLIYIYIYIYICVCVCVCVCLRSLGRLLTSCSARRLVGMHS
jgi:hypothetical protein